MPLSDPVVELLDQLPLLTDKPFLFPGMRHGKSPCNMAMLMTLRRMKRGDLRVHGLHSTFRDWAAGRTPYPRQVYEQALADGLLDKTEAAYRRGGLLEKRCLLMADWTRMPLADEAEDTGCLSPDSHHPQGFVRLL